MQAVESIENKLQPPSHPGEWTLKQIQDAIKRPLPQSMLKKLKDKGNAPYVPWFRVCPILDKYAPGWTWEIRSTHLSDDRIFIVGRLTLPTAGGDVWREATGTEELKRLDRKTGELTELAYGDPSSNAESMAFRRAAAKFGLALYLYEK
ncbi:DUF1071 domain-containing protein [Oscillatoriales cyanobacterium LEGE 11467]|uniref:DUF1071 domain-containing protein n=1 Tax=Zarconia navalis LEGE 11467 TaxID=1828826 RepID=A0A928VYW7_9CYAN|nr:DUF1071 domain-containing protein [Zarconia navalis]MBE9040708.1 DUF1071 domain-containing protein [Zarconia navalis LEGE 11467]